MSFVYKAAIFSGTCNSPAMLKYACDKSKTQFGFGFIKNVNGVDAEFLKVSVTSPELRDVIVDFTFCIVAFGKVNFCFGIN